MYVCMCVSFCFVCQFFALITITVTDLFIVPIILSFSLSTPSLSIALWLDKKLNFILFYLNYSFLFIVVIVFFQHTILEGVASSWNRFRGRCMAIECKSHFKIELKCNRIRLRVRLYVIVFFILNCFVIDCCWMEMRVWVMSNIQINFH